MHRIRPSSGPQARPIFFTTRKTTLEVTLLFVDYTNLRAGLVAEFVASCKTRLVRASVVVSLTGACSLVEEDQAISSASRGVRSHGGDRGYDDHDNPLQTTGQAQNPSDEMSNELGESTENAETGGHVQVEDATDAGPSDEHIDLSTDESTGSSTGEITSD